LTLLQLQHLAHIRARRERLRAAFPFKTRVTSLDETCIPSYCHPNVAFAFAAFWRLIAAAELAREFVRHGPVLDFGSSVGELFHLLPSNPEYHFVEADDKLADCLRQFTLRARRQRLVDLPKNEYAAVFALDSLEHNSCRLDIIARLHESLANDGIFLMSGPTENFVYRIGRLLAGFSGHYHETDIYRIEQEVSGTFRKLKVIRGPLALPLFRVSAWAKA